MTRRLRLQVQRFAELCALSVIEHAGCIPLEEIHLQLQITGVSTSMFCTSHCMVRHGAAEPSRAKHATSGHQYDSFSYQTLGRPGMPRLCVGRYISEVLGRARALLLDCLSPLCLVKGAIHSFKHRLTFVVHNISRSFTHPVTFAFFSLSRSFELSAVAISYRKSKTCASSGYPLPYCWLLLWLLTAMATFQRSMDWGQATLPS